MTPDSNNLYVGAGNVFFDRFDANGKSTGLRHLGNVDKLEITTSVELKEKKSAMDGTRATYAEVPVGSAAEIAMDISEFTKENVALAVLGQDGCYTQDANPAVADQAVGPDAASVQLDVWYDLGCLNPQLETVKQGAVALNAAAYEVNAEAGMIRLVSSYQGAGKAQAGQAITWSGSIPAITANDKRYRVDALAVGKIKGRLRFIGAKNQASGPRVMVDVWQMGINPDGALGLITEDFGNFSLKGKVYMDTRKPEGERFYRVIYL